MQLTGMRTKYYLLSVVAFVVAFVGLALLPTPAQAQQAPSIDKECTPNPVQVGQQITCTIVVEAAPGTSADVLQFTDTFPAGVRPTDVTAQNFSDGEPSVITTGQCTVSGQTVECLGFLVFNFTILGGENFTFEITIDAIAEQCGTFPNTATATGVLRIGLENPEPFSTASNTEQITVEGCEVPPGQQQGSPAPITQEGEQESESGEIDQSFEVS